MIAGAQLGTGASDNTLLSKSLQVTASGNPSFQVVSALLSRPRVNSEVGYLAMRVKNVGLKTECFISVLPLIYSDANAAPVRDGGLSYVRGTVAQLGSFPTGSCLEPGGEGFIIDLQLDSVTPSFYSRTTSLGFGWGITLGATTPVRGRLIPRQYTASPLNGNTDVVVTFVNEGPVTVTHSNPSVLMIPLDSSGRGLQFGYLNAGMSGSTTGPGATYVIRDQSYSFQGSATAMYSQVYDFEDCATCLVANRLDFDFDTPEGTERVLRAWTEQEDARRRALQP